jgi:hypothetical protein
MAAEFGLYYPPWNYTGKADDLLDRVAGEVGIDHVTVPVVTGEVSQFRLNRVRDEPYFHTEGGWHFPPRKELYKGAVRPATAAWFGRRDVVGRVCDRARDLGLQVFFRASTQLSPSLVDHVHLRRKDAWGQDIPVGLPCICNPELRELVRATLEDLERYGPGGFQVPSSRERWVCPPEGVSVRGSSSFYVWPQSYTCFCASCRQIAASAGVDPEQAARSVRAHAERVADCLDARERIPWRCADEVLEAYCNARANEHCDWLERLGDALAGRRRFCTWLHPAQPECMPANWTPYLEHFAPVTSAPEVERASPQRARESGVTATCIDVGTLAFREGVQLVNQLSHAVQTAIEFFDFEGVEESPAYALTWLKQAVRYARRG